MNLATTWTSLTYECFLWPYGTVGINNPIRYVVDGSLIPNSHVLSLCHDRDDDQTTRYREYWLLRSIGVEDDCVTSKTMLLLTAIITL